MIPETRPFSLDSAERIVGLLGRGTLEPWVFYGRMAQREAATTWYADAEGLPTLFGARVRPLAHQVHAARRIIGDRVQRFLLADEVGLGKTIETGLVLQALWHHRPDLSVLVIAPGAMVQQWWREIYLRFGARVFAYITGAPLAAAERERRLAGGRVLVSISALARDPALRDAVAARQWEAIVIDEAHHLDRLHPLYDFVHGLSKRADHALILSATPSRRELAGLAALLSLVDPDTYAPDDVKGLEARIAQRHEAWRAIRQTSELLREARREQNDLVPEDVASIVEEWGDVLRSDTRIDRWLVDACALPVPAALDRITRAVAYAQERWRLDHRIIRTRRRTLATIDERFPERRLEAEIDYDASAGELRVAELMRELPAASTDHGRTLREVLMRLAASTPARLEGFVSERLGALDFGLPASDDGFTLAWQSDPGPAEEEGLLADAARRCPALEPDDVDQAFDERAWLRRVRQACRAWADQDGALPARHRAAIGWLRARVEEDAERRFLVFSQDRPVVEAFAAAVTAEAGLGVRRFHHGMPEEELEKAALDFLRGGDVRVLVSDELGGEGRNFQTAWAVVHLDQPTSPARVEQRIGRIDRLGRPADEPVRSATVVGPLEIERHLHRLHRDVFCVHSGSIGGLEFVVPRLVRRIREDVIGCRRAERDWFDAMQTEVRVAREEADEAFEEALDTARHGLNQARDLVEILDEELLDEARTAPVHWMKALGVEVSKAGHERSVVRIDRERVDDALPGTPSFIGTWRRADALEHENLQFLAPGHRLVDAAYRLLDASDLGRVIVFGRSLGRDRRGRYYALVLLIDDLPDPGERLPAGLVTRAHALLGRDVHRLVLAFDPDNAKWVVDASPDLLTDLERPYQARRGDVSLDGPAASLAGEVHLWGGLADAIQAHLEADATAQRGHAAAERLAEAWIGETAYFDALIEHGTPAERARAEQDKSMRTRLLEAMRGLRPWVDAIAVVMGL